MNGAPIHHRIPHGSRNPKSGRGVAGAFIGGFIAKATRPGDPIDEFFDFSTWLGASIGSIVLLLIYRGSPPREVAGERRTDAQAEEVHTGFEPGPPASDDQLALAMRRACISPCKMRRARLDSACVADLGWD